VDAELKDNILNSIISEFDKSYELSNKNYKKKITYDYEYLKYVLQQLLIIQENHWLKYNKEKYLLSTEVNLDTENSVSPFAKYLDLILAQSDFVKKQKDIIKFAMLATRGPMEGESIHWLYCKETNLPLLPRFKLKLAQTNSNDYNNVINQIIKEIGVLNDDKDKWVDKHTGYVIVSIDLDNADEYDANGFRAISSDIIEDDEEDELNKKAMDALQEEEDNANNSPDTNTIITIIRKLSKAMSLNLDEDVNFIINTVIELSKDILSESQYEKIRKKRKDIDESYEFFKNKYLYYYTFCVFFICAQTTTNESTRKEKMYPQCKRSFSGYPVNNNLGSDSDESGFKYLICIVYYIYKQDFRWSKSKETINQIKSELKDLINGPILKNAGIIKKIDDKNAPPTHIESNKNRETINWTTYLPPLVKFKLDKLSNISSEKMDSLKKDLRTGNKAQHEAILILHSKIIQFSFGIIEKIQEVVHNEELILKKANYELYLENSCCQEKCDDSNEYAVSYFEKKSEDILKYNGYVKDLTDRIDNIAQYTKASILSSNINTKIESIPLSKGFEENTIILTFIKCCHYKTLQPVPTIFNMVCPEKPVFDLKNNNTKEMIKKIKENPQFTELYINNFPQLLQIANRQNIYHPQSKTKSNELDDSLEEDVDDSDKDDLEDESKIKSIDADDELTEKMFEHLDNDDKRDELYNAASEKIDIMRKKIATYLNDNASVDHKNDAISFIMKKLEDTNIDTKDVNYNYNYIKFISTFILNFVNIYPNIILNNKRRTITIPSYLNISKIHADNLKKIITKYYENLSLKNKNKNKDNLSEALANIQIQCQRFVKQSNNTSLEYVQLNKILQKYYFYKVLDAYISIDNTLRKEISNLLVTWLNVMKYDKEKIIDVFYEEIQEITFRLTQKEKKEMTDRLNVMTIQEREVNTELKRGKLEEWAKGLQKSVFNYDKSEFDAGVEFIEGNKEFERIERSQRRGDGDNEDMDDEYGIESIVDDEENNNDDDYNGDDYNGEMNDDAFDRDY
jgi:hypothetical protein